MRLRESLRTPLTRVRERVEFVSQATMVVGCEGLRVAVLVLVAVEVEVRVGFVGGAEVVAAGAEEEVEVPAGEGVAASGLAGEVVAAGATAAAGELLELLLLLAVEGL